MAKHPLTYQNTKQDIYIYIAGHSGCQLEIINNHTILKTTTNKDYKARLKTQCEKQILFANMHDNHDKILIPQVLQQYWETKDNEKVGFSMPYYYASDFIVFFENATITSIAQTMRILLQFIENNLKDSIYTTINKEIFCNKYDEVAQKINTCKNKSLTLCLDSIKKDLHDLPNEIILPLGRCHGDLTFSNILFSNDKIILIDFLDNFIETPLQDIVKLRQDTKHKWSVMLYERSYDNTKIAMLLCYLDEMIDKHFMQYEFYRKYYTIFQKINLFRILPYAKDNHIFDYVVTEILNLNIKDTICQTY